MSEHEQHLAGARLAQDAAQRAMQAAVASLARARSTESGATWTLACARELRVASQRHTEALALVAEAERALGGVT